MFKQENILTFQVKGNMGIFHQSTFCGLSRVIDEFSSGAAESHSYSYIQLEPDFSRHEPIPKVIHSNSR
jgi:hypothetical protein